MENDQLAGDVLKLLPILQVGLTGEKMKVFTQSGSHRVEWKKADGQRRALTWYKVC